MEGQIEYIPQPEGNIAVDLQIGRHGTLYLNREKGWTVFLHDRTLFATFTDAVDAVDKATPPHWAVTRKNQPTQ